MRRAGLYMRVSSDQQAREGESLGFQSNLLRTYVKNRPDMIVYDEYIDDGISGTKFDKRDELQRMLKDVEKGNIDVILFTKLDRFFRSVRHLMNTLDILDKYGVEWKAIQENYDNTPSGKLTLTIMGAFAELESNMDSQRIRDAFQHKISKKEWLNTHPPFGYRIENKHAVPDPETEDIARSIFSDYLKHNKISTLIKDYASSGAPSSIKGMKALLSNRGYIGEAHGQKDYLPAIIDRDAFESVQRLLAMNVKASAKHTYLFSGLMYCPDCGRLMTAYSNHGYPRYKCRYTFYNQCTYKHIISGVKLEQFLIDRYKDDLQKRYIELKEKKKVDNSQKIKSINRKIDRLKDLYLNELIDLRTYKDDLEMYKAELNNLEQPQEANTERLEKLMQMNVYDIYHTLTREQKRRLWRSVIKSITPREGTFFVEYL